MARCWRGAGALCLAVILPVAACTESDRSPVIRPDAPPRVPDAPLPRADIASVVDVPILVDLAVLTAELNDHVPVQRAWDDIALDDDAPPVALALTRGPFTASFDDEIATVSTTIAYALRTRYRLPLLPDMPASCGTDPDRPAPRMSVSLEGPVTLTPDWTLDSRVRVARVAPASDLPRDRCEVTMFGVDVTDRVAEAARDFLSDEATTIDSIVGSVDLVSDVEGWWRTIATPVRLDDDVWLDLGPEQVALAGVRGNAEALEILASLTARPRIIFGPRPGIAPPPLPRVGTTDEGRSFHTAVHVLVGYAELGALITRELESVRFRAGGRSLHAARVTVSGIGANEIVVEAEISGDAEGVLYLVGTPTYSTSEGVVRLPDLTMSVSTSNLLVAGASWVLDAGIESLLREQVRWPVATGIVWAEDRLQEGLNAVIGEGLRLRGDVEELVVVGVSARTEGLLIEARAAGQVELLVGGGA